MSASLTRISALPKGNLELLLELYEYDFGAKGVPPYPE